ncbi:MAG: large conductance mechanosensitive channel protein MscL [Bifidobacteriaceae bacterium]|jgi:large conductance mechanosensitive channel|nr:large conductance mechanosensitive channel protein MscL [Bifidobacteriaceae bacterium]
MKGFRDFLMRGNLIDLAVAFILGASFGAVVSSFTQVIMDLIGLAGGNPNFDTVAVGPIVVGKFLTALVSFVIVAAVLYFAVVRPYQILKGKLAKKDDEPDAPTAEELLTEIRDLLTQKR